jgi:hypothetical protein
MIDNAHFHFRYGQCHALAIALHRRTRLPLGIIIGEYGDAAESKVELCLPVVMVGDGGYLDVDGYHDRIEAVMLGLSGEVSSVKMVPAGIDEVVRFFDDDGVDPEMVRQAAQFVDADPTLNEYFDRHRSVDLRV